MTSPISTEFVPLSTTDKAAGEIAVITSDNPPVNALSHAVRLGLQTQLRAALARDQVKAIVLACAGRSFFAGADIKEFGKPMQEPFLPDLINEIEATPLPVVAALHGTALGGGLEVALGAHYRVAADTAKMGLPEVSIGLLPGAGGTQRLPRIVPVAEAAQMISSGRPISAAQAMDMGLVDQLVPLADLRAAAIAHARKLVNNAQGPRPTRDRDCAAVTDAQWQALTAKVAASARGAIAPAKAMQALRGALDLPFDAGLAQERALFMDLMQSDQRAALIHAFFAERQVAKLSEIDGIAPRALDKIGVVGGGTMGAGIAVSALMAGCDVTLAERDDAAAAAAMGRVQDMLAGAVQRGKLAPARRDSILTDQFRTTTAYDDFAPVDLVIEAVFESMEVKQAVFAQLDQICKPGAILATNTSYLDVDAIAQMTGRPQDVIGLHFFSPAHVMRLLEVVVGDATAPDVTATGFALAKKLGKIAVRAGVCDGFIGNRLLSYYQQANTATVLAGASPYAVDQALTGFGLAMGPYAVNDLAGLDISWANRKRLAATRDPKTPYPDHADRLCEMGRFGRKTGRGFYIYDEGAKNGRPDPEVADIIAQERAEKGITPRSIDAEEIVDRYMAAMVNEAARIVAEGIALRPLDVDVTLLNGYGFPRWRGGPMHYADTVGLAKIVADIKRFAADDPHFWRVAPLLDQLAAEGRTFASLNQA